MASRTSSEKASLTSFEAPGTRDALTSSQACRRASTSSDDEVACGGGAATSSR